MPWPHLAPHLDLPFAHDLVQDLIVVLVDLGLVVALLIAQDPQGLRALQLDLELLRRWNEGPEPLRLGDMASGPTRTTSRGMEGCSRFLEL